jgi:hypothetical protein
VNSIFGEFPYKNFLSFKLAPIKYYPASLRFMGKNKQKYGDLMNPNVPSGCLELFENNMVKYHFPLSHRNDFYIT